MELPSEELSSGTAASRTPGVVVSVGILLLMQGVAVGFLVVMDIVEILRAQLEVSFWTSFKIASLTRDALFAAAVAILFLSAGWAVLARTRGSRFFAGLVATLDLAVSLGGLLFGKPNLDVEHHALEVIAITAFIFANGYILLTVLARRAAWQFN